VLGWRLFFLSLPEAEKLAATMSKRSSFPRPSPLSGWNSGAHYDPGLKDAARFIRRRHVLFPNVRPVRSKNIRRRAGALVEIVIVRGVDANMYPDGVRHPAGSGRENSQPGTQVSLNVTWDPPAQRILTRQGKLLRDPGAPALGRKSLLRSLININFVNNLQSTYADLNRRQCRRERQTQLPGRSPLAQRDYVELGNGPVCHDLIPHHAFKLNLMFFTMRFTLLFWLPSRRYISIL
jgi:hypothetical protein